MTELEKLNYIRNHIVLNKKRWKHIFSTNCYAYALGLDIREKDIFEYLYQPGSFGRYLYAVNNSKYFDYSSLIEGIKRDMKELGIEIREINPEEEVSEEEWKIALFTVFHANEFYSEYLSDFHFLRQNDDKIWYHKPGYLKPPTNKDYNGQIILHPEDCYLGSKQYRKCYSLKVIK